MVFSGVVMGEGQKLLLTDRITRSSARSLLFTSVST